MSGLTRIFSDLHYGDRASRLHSLSQLRPLLEGPDNIILNGDTLDTRHGPYPQRTARARAEVADFFGRHASTVTHLTGNHDPDISPHHSLDLANGQVFVTHGDIIFDNVVPWGRDATFFSKRLAVDLAALPAADRTLLAPRLGLYRAACLALPQRHQAEPNPFKYLINLAADTVWPPLRTLRIFRAWQETPARAAAVAANHRPAARFMLIGHTHQPGVWRLPSGLTVINTGSLTRPFGAYAVDLTPGRLTIRRIVFRAAAFYPGAIVADFALAEFPTSPKIRP